MDALNEKFVFIKVNGAKDEGVKEFRKTYKVIGFPTVLLLQADGTEVDRVVGFGFEPGGEVEAGDAFMKTMDSFAAGEGTLLALTGELEADPDNLELLEKLAEKRLGRYEFTDAAVHFKRILELDPENTTGLKDKAHFYVAMADARDGNTDALAAIVETTENPEYLMMGTGMLARVYRQAKAFDKIIPLYEKMLASSPEDTGLMNQFAWMVYEEKLADYYNRAIEVAEKAVALAPEDAAVMDTLAWLYAVDGQQEKALATMEKAVALEPKFQEGLNKMKAGEI